MSRVTGIFGLFLTSIASGAFAARVTRQTCLDSVCYLIPDDFVWKFGSSFNLSGSVEDELIPFTVVNVNRPNIQRQDVLDILGRFGSFDDVWQPSFASYVYVQQGVDSIAATADAGVSDVASDAQNLFYSPTVGRVAILPEGPYFLDATTKKLRKAYRLYDDTQQAFLQSSYQDPAGSHSNLQAGSVGAGSVAVAVPSRLYYTKSLSQPLAGVRIAVKDLFDLKGMKKSGGSRAFFSMAQQANETAPAVQKLIDAGAVVVGKNKMSEFAWAGPYHMDHIGYLLPFNPRGDGYNSPADSSGGAGASVASYDWLDLALGTDTGGSIRAPASYNGIHGNRPSHGAVDLKGAIPFSTSMDTAGFLARDPLVWADAIDVLYNGTIKNASSFPATVFVDGDDLPGTDELYQAKVEDIYWKFSLDLASAIGAKVTNMTDIDTIWNNTRPAEFSNIPLYNAYAPLYTNLTRYEQATTFGFPFLNAYTSAHNGAYPYIAPQILSGWENKTQTIDAAAYQRMLDKKAAITQWASNNLFKADPSSCADSLFITYYGPAYEPKPVLSDSDPNPSVADLYARATSLESQLSQCRSNNNRSSASAADDDGAPSANIWRIASVADLPMSIVTLGDFVSSGNYTYSNITRQKQRLPYSIGLTTRHGCDFVLSRVIRLLSEKGIVKSVKAGASVTEGGEIGM